MDAFLFTIWEVETNAEQVSNVIDKPATSIS